MVRKREKEEDREREKEFGQKRYISQIVRISGDSLKISFRTRGCMNCIHLHYEVRYARAFVCYNADISRRFDLSTHFKAPLHANKRALTAVSSVERVPVYYMYLRAVKGC